jgi:hypothetical protein
MFGTGMPTAEKPQAKKFYIMSHGPGADNIYASAWKNYKMYLKRTSILIPIPPALYTRLPGWLKRTLLLDFPMYAFDESKDGSEAVEEARKQAVRGG